MRVVAISDRSLQRRSRAAMPAPSPGISVGPMEVWKKAMQRIFGPPRAAAPRGRRRCGGRLRSTFEPAMLSVVAYGGGSEKSSFRKQLVSARARDV
jgi:hypothetical protein